MLLNIFISTEAIEKNRNNKIILLSLVILYPCMVLLMIFNKKQSTRLIRHIHHAISKSPQIIFKKNTQKYLSTINTLSLSKYKILYICKIRNPTAQLKFNKYQNSVKPFEDKTGNAGPANTNYLWFSSMLTCKLLSQLDSLYFTDEKGSAFSPCQSPFCPLCTNIADGFAASSNTRKGQLFKGNMFTSDIDVAMKDNVNKVVLLCKVVLGRTLALNSNEQIKESFVRSKYDSIVAYNRIVEGKNEIDKNEYCAFGDNCAVPLFLVKLEKCYD